MLLQKEKELQEIVQLIGPDALPDTEKIVLLSAKIIREDFLQQNAYSDDSFCPLEKQYDILKVILKFYHKIRDNYNQGIPLEKMTSLSVLGDIAKLKWAFDDEFKELLNSCNKFIENEMNPSNLGLDN